MPKLTAAQRRLLVAARKERGHSQTEVGRQCGCSAAAISYFEAGARQPADATLQRWWRALGLTLRRVPARVVIAPRRPASPRCRGV